MSTRFKRKGLAILAFVVTTLGLIAAGYALHSKVWILIIPLAVILLMLLIAALPIKKKITPQQFANLLEPHLLGTDGPWGWDDAISVALADERLELLRLSLPKFDRLHTDELREELREIIAALRRGEVPDVRW
jgi:hypothetical protein